MTAVLNPGRPFTGPITRTTALVTEPIRAAIEYGWLMAATLPLWRALPTGDGHPVLVLPGFLAGDGSTRPLRRILRRLGYQVHSWHLGRNLGPTDAVLTGMTHRLRELHTRHDATVSLIGWSLGGIYARGLARWYPSLVRQVIALGSPFRLVQGSLMRLALTSHRQAAELTSGYDGLALPVPATSISSRYDGLVPWRACLDAPSAYAENVAVIGSHLGLGYNPAVIWAIADRLAQPLGTWAAFRPPATVRLLFPPPDTAPKWTAPTCPRTRPRFEPSNRSVTVAPSPRERGQLRKRKHQQVALFPARQNLAVVRNQGQSYTRSCNPR